MSKAIYLSGTKGRSEKSFVSIGMINLLLGKLEKIGYFKPVIGSELTDKDPKVSTIVNNFNLEQKYEDSFSYTFSESMQEFNRGNFEIILDKILKDYKNLEEKNDFVLIEGIDMAEGFLDKTDINIGISSNLGLPVILVCSGEDKTVQEILLEINISYDRFREQGIKVLGIVVNNVDNRIERVLDIGLKKIIKKGTFLKIVPLNCALDSISIKQVSEDIDCDILAGKEKLNNKIENMVFGGNILKKITEKTLVVTSSDRADILPDLISNEGVSGVLFTDYEEKNNLIEMSKSQSSTPVMVTNNYIEEVINDIYDLEPTITEDDKEKVDLCINYFEKYLNTDNFLNNIISKNTKSFSPRTFLYGLFEKAIKNKKHIVLPESEDDRILTASVKLINQGVVDITLLGEKEKVEKRIIDLGLNVDLSKINIINPKDSDKYEEYWRTFYELRKEKGVNETMAQDIMLDVSYFGTMMVHKGDADGMVSGAINTTGHTIKPSLQFVKTKKGVSVVSSVFFMCLKDKVYLFGDCAVNPNPTSEQLAEIAITSADSAKSFGIEPRVAMLSYSSGSSGKGEDVDAVRKATEIVKEKRSDIKVEGPIQYDAAVDMGVGSKKLPNSDVAGQANVFIFPDLNTGNNTYKAVQREAKSLAVGPMLQGLNKPINDLSRGCLVEDIYNTVIITAIQAGQNN